MANKKKPKTKKILTTKELDGVSGGFGFDSIMGLFRSSPPQEVVAQKPLEKAPKSQSQQIRDALDVSQSKPAPKANLQKALKGAARGLEFLQKPSQDEPERRLRKLDGFARILGRLKTKGAKDPEAMASLRGLAQKHSELVQKLLPDLFASSAAVHQGEMTQESLDTLASHIGTLKQHGVAHLSPDERIKLKAAIQDLQSSLTAGSKKSQDKGLKEQAELLRTQLRNLVIRDERSDRVRYEQARYMMDIRMPTHVSDQMSNRAFKTDQQGNRQIDSAQAKVSSKVRTQIEEQQKKRLEAAKAKYGFYFADGQSTDDRMSTLDLMKRVGVEPTSRQQFSNESLHLSVAGIEAAAKKGGVSYLNIPGHAMLIFCDPKTNTYRFFDPNSGLYKFDNAKEFAEQVALYTHNIYNDSMHPVFGEEGSGKPRKPEESTIDEHLEMPLYQTQNQHISIGEGVCNAMAAALGKWALEHPGYQGQISSKVLFLGAYDAIGTYQRQADELQRSGNYEQAFERSLQAVRTASDLDPDSDLVENATDLIYAGKADEALKMLKAHLKDKPNDALAQSLVQFANLYKGASPDDIPDRERFDNRYGFTEPSSRTGDSFSIALTPIQLASS